MTFHYKIFRNSNTVSNESSSTIAVFINFLQANNIPLSQIVKLTAFYNSDAIIQNDVVDLKNALQKEFNEQLPALTFVSQPPLCGSNIIFEIVYLTDKAATITYHEYNGYSYTKVATSAENHIIIGGLQEKTGSTNIQQNSETSFKVLETIFEHEDYTFSNIVRQWNYIEGIIDQNEGNQNYQIFNDVRTKYYEKNKLKSDYPAATGIGILKGGVIIDIHAIKNISTITIDEIINPLQINAYSYSEEVLEGNPTAGLNYKTTPKFARGKAITNYTTKQLLISGTASIEGENTIGINDAAKQTEYTINNISQLINVSKPTDWETEKALQHFELVRVYIKSANDYKTIKNVCEKHFSPQSVLYVIADICRDNLLVEIEGIVTISIA